MRHGRRCAGALLALATAGCFTAANTKAPPGVPGKFDPIAEFTAMATYAGPHARALRLQASHVGVDGTMDLTAASKPKVEAEFVAAAIEGDPATRPAGEFAVGHAIRVRLTVEAPHTRHVQEDGSEWDEQHLGMERVPTTRATGDEKTVEPPACTFAALWAEAIELGAPAGGTATIAYDADGYAFAVDGGDFKQRFKADCSPVAAKRAKKK